MQKEVEGDFQEVLDPVLTRTCLHDLIQCLQLSFLEMQIHCYHDSKEFLGSWFAHIA